MKSNNSPFLRLVGTILGVTLVVSILILGAGYFAKWHQPVQYSNAFFAAGGILVVLGVLSVAGGFLQRSDFKMIYSESAGQANLTERSQRIMADVSQRYGSMILLLSAGILLIIVSILIGQFLI